MTVLDEIINSASVGMQERQQKAAMAGGAGDSAAVWNKGNLNVTAVVAPQDEGPGEEISLLVKKAMEGDQAARESLELQAALGNQYALNAIVSMDAFAQGKTIDEATIQKALSGDKAALDKIATAAALGDTIAANAINVIRSTGIGMDGTRATDTSIDEATVQKALGGDKAALDKITTAAALGDNIATNALNVIRSTGTGTTPSKTSASTATGLPPTATGLTVKRSPTTGKTMNVFGPASSGSGGNSGVPTHTALTSSAGKPSGKMMSLGLGGQPLGKTPAPDKASAPAKGRGGGGGGGGAAKKPYQNIKGNPSAIPHIKIDALAQQAEPNLFPSNLGSSPTPSQPTPSPLASFPTTSQTNPTGQRKQVYAWGDKTKPMGNAWGRDAQGKPGFYT